MAKKKTAKKSKSKTSRKKPKISRKKIKQNIKLSPGKPVPKKTLWMIFGLLVIVVVALIFFYYSKGLIGKAFVTECDTTACFIEKANECEPARYLTKIGTSTIEMEVTSDCKLKKTVIDLDETEPEEIREFFKEKYMICNYEKGAFNEDFAYQISGPLGECAGPLKDAIEAVI